LDNERYSTWQTLNMTAIKTASNRYSVPNLERALQIIEFLVDQSNGCSITENSVFRILKTMQLNGYLNESGKSYQLSAKFLALGYAALGEVNLVDKAINIMRDLRDELKETVLFGKIIGSEGVILEEVLGLHQVKFMVDVGYVFPLHATGPGKAMLANLPEQELHRVLDRIHLERFTKRTITDRKALLKALKQIQREGYAVDNAEKIEGLICIACPVFDHQRYPIASIWITGPSFRIPVSDFNRMGAIVKKHALKISQRLGYEPMLPENDNN